jgi:hypothetical protein
VVAKAGLVAAICLGALAGCSIATNGTMPTEGSGAVTGGSGTNQSSGMGMSSGNGAAGSSGFSSGDDGGVGSGSGTVIVPPGTRTPPTCATPVPSPNGPGSITCDFLDQSIDFEADAGYPSPPGSIKITAFGSALGDFQINDCHPVCYTQNLTVGLDIVAGGDPKQLQGEVIAQFPAPLPMGNGRNSLGWIYIDGPNAPPFEINAQLVAETPAGVFAAAPMPVPFRVFKEFKYFPVGTGTFGAALTNITGMGFRIMAPANTPAGQEFHGVIYIDHLQIRLG